MQRGDQRVSYTAIVLLILFWLTLFISLFVSVGGKLQWLDFLYVASYVKLAITLVKYVPQVSLLTSILCSLLTRTRRWCSILDSLWIMNFLEW